MIHYNNDAVCMYTQKPARAKKHTCVEPLKSLSLTSHGVKSASEIVCRTFTAEYPRLKYESRVAKICHSAPAAVMVGAKSDQSTAPVCARHSTRLKR